MSSESEPVPASARHAARSDSEATWTPVTPHDDLQALGELAARGDPAALDELLHRIRPTVLRQCSRLLPCQADAEDATQEALVKIARGVSTYAGRARFTTWLHQVTSNAARDTYRRLKQESERSDVELPEVVDPRRTSVIVGTRIDVLEALEQLEETSPELVAPFVLRDLHELPYVEVSRVLDRPLGTVKRQIHEARLRIRSLL